MQNATEEIGKADALGITKDTTNYLKKLWRIHCKDIEGLDFAATDLEEEIEDFQNLEHEDTSGAHQFAKIISIINSEEKDAVDGDQQHLYDWLEKKIFILNRLKSDLELQLRNATIVGQRK